MGNICAKEVEPENEETEDLEERGTKSVAQRRATKGAGLLGKTDWSDEEDEENQTGEEATDKIADLPGAGDTSLHAETKNGERVTLMMQPEPVAVSCENDEPNQLTIIFLANIAEEDTAKLGAVKEFESQKRICIYIGELNAQSSSLHIDIAASPFPGIDGITTLCNATSLHHVIQKGEEKIGILVIEEVDESGKWIDNARKAANELRNSQKPHLIIALLISGTIQARKLATCNILGIKCILCTDANLPSDETVQLGTTIISLNPNQKQYSTLTVTFDSYHETDFGNASILPY